VRLVGKRCDKTVNSQRGNGKWRTVLSGANDRSNAAIVVRRSYSDAKDVVLFQLLRSRASHYVFHGHYFP
jgi:hypothetical protein